jgi:hypothetical protein
MSHYIIHTREENKFGKLIYLEAKNITQALNKAKKKLKNGAEILSIEQDDLSSSASG